MRDKANERDLICEAKDLICFLTDTIPTREEWDEDSLRGIGLVLLFIEGKLKEALKLLND